MKRKRLNKKAMVYLNEGDIVESSAGYIQHSGFFSNIIEAARKNIVCWWSGGITSAMACKIAIDFYGVESCDIVMIDTLNEDEDTYRFLNDCESLYGKKIKRITAIKGVEGTEFVDIGKDYSSIQDVWHAHKSLNVATGAVCSTMLKRTVREKWQKTQEYDHQVFGFEFIKKEMNRALSLSLNHPKAKAIFPLLMMAYTKEQCIDIFEKEYGISVPNTYKLGFRNNNCFKTGCTQGGVGYWQKMKREFPAKFNAMADQEHSLTELKGEPVTMLKDQSKEAKESGNILVFLKKNSNYPNLKSIDEMPECKVEALFECNGFCGVDDLNEKTEAHNQVNYQSLFGDNLFL